MFWKRKPTFTAAALAQAIQAEFVETSASQVARILNGPREAAERLSDTARTYAIASVLVAILRQDRRSDGLNALRMEFERRAFPSEFSQPVLDEIKSAMNALNGLYSGVPQRGEIRWAHEWLRRVGVEEANPATLALLAFFWLNHHLGVQKMLSGCRIA